MASFSHRDPDRVPIDFSGHRSSGIAAIAYVKLRKYMGLPEKRIRVYDPVQQLAIVDDDVLDRFGVDAIELGRGFALEDQYWADWTLPDGTPCQMPVWGLPKRENGTWVIRSKSGRVLAHMPEGVLQFEQVNYPFAEVANVDDIRGALAECMWSAIPTAPGPLGDGPEGLKRLTETAKAFRQKTDRAIIGLFGGNFLELGQWLYRNDNFYVLLAAEPKKAHEFLDKLLEVHLANLERFLGAVGPYIDIILFGDDMGMQTGPQVSLRMHREFFKPRQKILWGRSKQLANAKVMLHCCGGVRELLPDMIEVGLDTINPVQISCRGMDPKELKREFGKDIVFWGGGCDTQEVLPYQSPEAIKKHVRELVSVLSSDGGFVFQQVHNILAHIPPQNVVAMFDAVLGRA